MDQLIISDAVLIKLRQKHQVSRREVEQCFQNRLGRLLYDARESHKTDPPTLWFIASTHKGRWLKIVYIQINEVLHLKTAYEPNDVETKLYKTYGWPS